MWRVRDSHGVCLCDGGYAILVGHRDVVTPAVNRDVRLAVGGLLAGGSWFGEG